ncbi:MAG: GNAT family N-acetyltransferase [Thermovirgaceae bacterium]|nr:GNAT family N-acetyltransferase [Thermovirgaceae bacterium]
MTGTQEVVEYTIEPWSGDLRDLRGSFDCGGDDLNSCLKRQASQDIDKRACALFAALNPGKDRIAGFYTLAMYSVNLPDIPSEIHNKLPKYPLVPAVLLGRLAVDLKFRGKGVDELLLLDAMKRALDNEISWWAMIVHSKEESRSFYLRYGFCEFDDEKYRLFLTHETIRKAFEENR